MINKKAMTIAEILVVTVISVLLLGIVYVAYSNVSRLQRINKLENEFKQESATALQEITRNMQDAFTNNAGFYTPNIKDYVYMSIYCDKVVYDTGNAEVYDTIGFYSASKTKLTGGILYKTYIRYGLRKFPSPAPGKNLFQLYRYTQENIVNKGTPNVINTSSPVGIPILGYYKNEKNYLGVSKLSFKLKGSDIIEISMQLVGCVSRGGGTVSPDIYKPSSTTFYTTSAQMKINSGQSY